MKGIGGKVGLVEIDAFGSDDAFLTRMCCSSCSGSTIESLQATGDNNERDGFEQPHQAPAADKSFLVIRSVR
eukprot:m.83553 g.83553  ORF g.83553 m.83553 type:complete len:72 (+) comp12724_c0_seq2:376-591(+)